MKKTVIWIIVIILIVIGITYFSKDSSKKEVKTDTGGTYKIGVMVPLTGDGAAYGEPARNIYQIAAEEINASGGIGGKQIQLIIEDSKCTGDGGVNAAQKLVNVDKVQIILGGFCSSESLAGIPVAEAGKVALFSPGSSSPDLTGKSAYYFRNYPSDATQGQVLAQVAYDKGYKKIAFLQEQTDYALGNFKAFEAKFTSLGGAVVKEEYPSTVRDYRSQIAKLKAQKPDAFFIDGQTPATMEIVVQQFKASGWKTQLFTNDILMSAPDVLSKYKSTVEGMIGAEFSFDPNNAKFAHITEAYKTKYNTEMPFQSYGQTEYDALFMIKDAIQTVGYDGTKIADWGHHVTNWMGASGSVTIGANGDRVGGHHPEVIKDGKAIPLTQ